MSSPDRSSDTDGNGACLAGGRRRGDATGAAGDAAAGDIATAAASVGTYLFSNVVWRFANRARRAARRRDTRS